MAVADRTRKAVVPSGVERTMAEDELIVSKTDTRGIMTYVNDVFLRVSAYPESEVLGQPHNMIRHPDMPRCVFKLLWDTIKSGQEIFAYVVNLAADGAHYWVFAHVTPSFDTTGRVVAEVPRGWDRQVRDSGWDPRALGLPSGHEAGFAVADRLTAWQDLTAEVNGVLVGLSGHGDLTAAVNALTHPGCHYDGARAYTGAVWHGRVRTWDGCPGGGSVTEAALAPADGSAQTRMYVQMRQTGRASATDRILASVRISS